MDAVRVLQVVGFKNSGKTALMLRLLGIAKESGKTVSTIKHHGHGGPPDMPSSATDSTRFFTEGAASSIVYGGGVIQLHQRKEAAGLEGLIAMAHLAEPEVILVEGFKEASYEKIVLARTEEEWKELKELNKIALVIVSEDLRLVGVETVRRNNQQLIKSWFLKWMEGGSDEGI